MATAFVNRNKTAGDAIGYFKPEYSVDNRILSSAAGARTIKANTVLGVITADGKLAEHDQDAVDGTEVAAAVNLYDQDVPASGDLEAPVIVRFATVRKAGLIWQPDIDGAETLVALAELQAAGIVPRDT